MESTPADSPRGDWRQTAARLATFGVVIGMAALLGLSRPVRDALALHNIETVALSLGAWGPLLLVALGALTPLLFIPRWPICFVAGLLYGVAWGALLSTAASLPGAWLQFALARNLLARTATRLISRSRLARVTISPERTFLGIFLLRAFPLSNFVATNLFAGALKLRTRPYLIASFLGMIPSSLMYAAWGKFAKKPSWQFLALAVLCMLTVAAAYLAAARRSPRWWQGGRAPEGRGQTPEA